MDICPYCKIGVADLVAHLVVRHDPETHDLIEPPAVKPTLAQRATSTAWRHFRPDENGHGPAWLRAATLAALAFLAVGVAILVIVIIHASFN